MKVLFKIIIFSFCLLAQNSAFASCDDGASRRNFAGPKKIVQSLWRKLQDSEVPVWSKGSFHHQDFKYVGQLQSNQLLHVVWFSTTSGQSCRATNRLLLFTKNGTFFDQDAGQLVDDARSLQVLAELLLFGLDGLVGHLIGL